MVSVDIGLVVLNYNDYETTEEFIKFVSKYKEIDKIVIVDNHSTDNSFQELNKLKSEKIDIVKSHINAGYANGNNLGIKYLIEKYKTKYIIISNPDVFFTENVLKQLISVLENKSIKVGLVSPKMRCLSSIDLPVGWKLPNFKQMLFNNFIILKKIIGDPLRYPEEYFNRGIKQVEVLQGSLFMSRATTLEDVKFFDTDTFLYFEEFLLCDKLKQKGYKNYILCDYEYDHRHSVSINKNILSVKKRLDIAHNSAKIYNIKCLRTNKIQNMIFSLSYFIGLLDYCSVNYIRRFFRKCFKKIQQIFNVG